MSEMRTVEVGVWERMLWSMVSSRRQMGRRVAWVAPGTSTLSRSDGCEG